MARFAGTLPRLINHFLRRCSRELDNPMLSVSDSFIRRLCRKTIVRTLKRVAVIIEIRLQIERLLYVDKNVEQLSYKNLPFADQRVIRVNGINDLHDASIDAFGVSPC